MLKYLLTATFLFFGAVTLCQGGQRLVVVNSSIFPVIFNGDEMIAPFSVLIARLGSYENSTATVEYVLEDTISEGSLGGIEDRIYREGTYLLMRRLKRLEQIDAIHFSTLETIVGFYQQSQDTKIASAWANVRVGRSLTRAGIGTASVATTILAVSAVNIATGGTGAVAYVAATATSSFINAGWSELSKKTEHSWRSTDYFDNLSGLKRGDQICIFTNGDDELIIDLPGPIGLRSGEAVQIRLEQ